MTFTKSDTPYGMRFTVFCSMMNLLVILLFAAKLVKKNDMASFSCKIFRMATRKDQSIRYLFLSEFQEQMLNVSST